MSMPSRAPRNSKRTQQPQGKKMGLPGRDLINPPYEIDNDAGSLSNKTIATDLVHGNGLVEYDVHNLYGLSKFLHSTCLLLC